MEIIIVNGGSRIVANEAGKDLEYKNDYKLQFKWSVHPILDLSGRISFMKGLRPVIFGRFVALLVVCSLLSVLSPAYSFEQIGSYESNRARLLGYLLRQDLEHYHFTHKEIDDKLSKAAFDLYLKQLDGQKRFFLKADVEGLRVYADQIDDELNSGKMSLPEIATALLSSKVAEVRKITEDLLSKDFDFSKDEVIETDAEKLAYCTTADELRERWRKTLKYQVLQRYLIMMDDDKPDQAKTSHTGDVRKGPRDPWSAAREKVLKEYESAFTRMLEETEREHYDRFFGAVARAFDPHTEYMPPMNKEDFDISMRGSLEGIGATLQEEDGYIKVVGIVTGGPAFRQKQLHPEDLILKVAEGKGEFVDITNMRVKDAVKLIRGKKGTDVRLGVRKPDGTQVVISIVRDVVQLEDTFVKGTALEDKDSGKTFGYLKIPSFYHDFDHSGAGKTVRNSTDDVRKELRELRSRKISGLVVDLRNDGGGALADAVNIAGLFIKKGPVVQVKNSDGKISVLSDHDPDVIYTGPVVVLVNKFSASASEIVAGALQDYSRAVIIGGEHTHGKGTVQSIVDLDDTIPFTNMEKYKTLGALKMTVQKFYRISGESTQYRGVLPDIVLPDRFSYVKSGERYLDFALPWDTVPPAQYVKWDHGAINISELRSRSAKRTLSNKELVEIDRESKRLLEQRNRTAKSLNLKIARAEFEEARKSVEKKNFHGHGDSADTHSDKVLTAEEKKSLWTKEVNEDVYIHEAVAVLDDMVSLGSVSMN